MSGSKTLVVSAINFREGGPLTILRQCVDVARRQLDESWRILVLVHSRDLITTSGVECVEYPYSVKSWLLRMYYEYCGYMADFGATRVDVWLSLHDTSPFVAAARQAVYCHNPAPFHTLTVRDAILDWRFSVVKALYRFVYRLNIEANKYVIVQQGWLAREFRKMCANPQVLVARPEAPVARETSVPNGCDRYFLYPAFPRVFKNFEVVGEACLHLLRWGFTRFEVRLTITGEENRYARWLYGRFKHISQIKFIGRQTVGQIRAEYLQCATVLFPSRLETWGLPLTEAKGYQRAIFAADLPYARETIGDYEKVVYFNPYGSAELALLMRAQLEGTIRWNSSGRGCSARPSVDGWEALIRTLTDMSAGPVEQMI